MTTRKTAAVRKTGREVDQLDLAWIAGLWDGDGWIGVSRQKRDSSQHTKYVPGAILATTSDRLAIGTEQVLGGLELRYGIHHVASHVGKDGSRRRAKWNIAITAGPSTEKFLTAIRPYLREKGRCADLVLGYIEWRKGLPAKPGGHAGAICAEQGEILFAALRQDRERLTPQRLHA